MTSPYETVTETRTLSVGGHHRRYLTTRPVSAGDAPLVLVLHGSHQTPETIRRFAGPGFDTLASRDGAVVVYPEGYRKHWNDARISTTFAARRDGYDDVAFLKAIVTSLSKEHLVDSARVFAVGYSLGGQMVNRLAHEAPQLLAGIAMIGATQHAAENFAPDADIVSPLPVLLVHGTRDPNVPYEGGMASVLGFRPRGLGLSAHDTAEYWAERNGVMLESTVELHGETARGSLPVQRASYGTSSPTPVVLFSVRGGGHVIPGTARGPRIMGRTASNLRTVDEIASFFGLRATD